MPSRAQPKKPRRKPAKGLPAKTAAKPRAKAVKADDGTFTVKSGTGQTLTARPLAGGGGEPNSGGSGASPRRFPEEFSGGGGRSEPEGSGGGGGRGDGSGSYRPPAGLDPWSDTSLGSPAANRRTLWVVLGGVALAVIALVVAWLSAAHG